MGFMSLRWFAAFSLTLLSHAAAGSPDISLAWNANSETNIARYELRYGTSSGVYTTTLNAGMNLRAVVSDLEADVTYYFAVYAYNSAGLRSDASQEAVYHTPPPPNHAPTGWISAPSLGGTIYAGQSVSFSGAGKDADGDALSYRWDFGNGSGIADSTAKSPGLCRFNIPGTYQVSLTVTDSKGSSSEPATLKIVVLDTDSAVISQKGWKLQFVNSEESNGYAATQAFDGNPNTFWHTRFTVAPAKLPKPPHQIQIYLGKARDIGGFEYLPRQDSNLVGTIGTYQFYVSMDGKKWGKPVATGTFADSSAQKQVFFATRQAKFIRLVSLSEADGYTDCSVAEINLLQGLPANRAPVSSTQALSTVKDKAVSFTLKGSDLDKNPLTFQIVKSPTTGTLSGRLPNLTFKPKSGFTGNATFTYRISDGTANSKVATVTIQVKAAAKAAAPQALLAASSAPVQAAVLLPSAPKAALPVTSTTVIGGEKFLVLTVAKPAIPDGVSRTVQVSSDLLDWFSGKNHTTVLLDNTDTLKVRDNTPIAPGKKRYIRLKPRVR
jgi:PKD repeat protein